ncbi:MAG TPA: SCO family protein [Stellaceae bacterium]|jgi:protein SCO1/2|nr:SCO family protein [Stellaceae bacterium]
MKGAILIAALVLMSSLAADADAMPRSTIPPGDFADFAFRQNLGAALPLDTELRRADGRTVALRSVFGNKPVLFDFEYDRCTTLCGLMLDRLTAALRELPLQSGRDYRIVAIDIDPDATSQQAVAFFREHGADPSGMTVMTGEEAGIRRIADAAGFPYRRDVATGQFAHPAGFVVATPDGRVSRYLLGLSWRPLDLRLALIEAAHRAVAVTPTEQVLLFCYCYDPQTGRYDLAIAKLLQVIGATTLLGLGGLVWLAVRKVG